MNVSKETKNMIISALLLTIAVIIQILGKNIPQINQFFVGPTVNAILLLTVYLSGVKWAVLIGVLTPVLAFLSGVLATPMAPFIPFIALGNLIYISIFALLKNRIKGEVIGVLLGSTAKFFFLYFSGDSCSGQRETRHRHGATTAYNSTRRWGNCNFLVLYAEEENQHHIGMRLEKCQSLGYILVSISLI